MLKKAKGDTEKRKRDEQIQQKTQYSVGIAQIKRGRMGVTCWEKAGYAVASPLWRV